jgi:predicted lipoprotein with Yx(FWY)xxD motif
MPALATVLAAALLAVATPTWTAANSVATGDQDHPSIATDRNGYVAVTWEDDRDTTDAANDNDTEVYLRLFHDGVSAYEIKLSPGGTSGVDWKHLTPDVGLDDKGNAVVVWADDPDGNGFFNIPYRVVSPTGAILGSGQANADAAGQQIRPKVAVDPDGTPNNAAAVAFSVVWEDIQGTAPATVKAAGYTAATTKAYEVTASQTTGAHHNPDVAVSASGDALVAWDEDADANGFFNVGLTRLAKTNGTVNLSRRTANLVADGQQQHAAIAANFAGAFTVAWESDHTGAPGVWTRSFLSDGTPRTGEIDTAVGGTAPTAGIDDQAGVVVGWTVPGTEPDVWVRGLDPDGSTPDTRLSAQQLSQATAGRQEGMTVAVSPWAEVAVAYTDDNDGNLFDQVELGTGMTNSAWLTALRRTSAGKVPGAPAHTARHR